MMTSAQCRAARALADITQRKLAEMSGVSLRAIVNFEQGSSSLVRANMRVLQECLEGAGVEFLEGGVRLRQG